MRLQACDASRFTEVYTGLLQASWRVVAMVHMLSWRVLTACYAAGLRM